MSPRLRASLRTPSLSRPRSGQRAARGRSLRTVARAPRTTSPSLTWPADSWPRPRPANCDSPEQRSSPQPVAGAAPSNADVGDRGQVDARACCEQDAQLRDERGTPAGPARKLGDEVRDHEQSCDRGRRELQEHERRDEDGESGQEGILSRLPRGENRRNRQGQQLCASQRSSGVHAVLALRIRRDPTQRGSGYGVRGPACRLRDAARSPWPVAADGAESIPRSPCHREQAPTASARSAGARAVVDPAMSPRLHGSFLTPSPFETDAPRTRGRSSASDPTRRPSRVPVWTGGEPGSDVAPRRRRSQPSAARGATPSGRGVPRVRSTAKAPAPPREPGRPR